MTTVLGVRSFTIISQGPVGPSAYNAAVANGFVGSVTDFIASLKGDKGDTGIAGPTGGISTSAAQILIDTAIAEDNLTDNVDFGDLAALFHSA